MATISIRSASRQDEETILRFHRNLYIDHRDLVVEKRILPLIQYEDFDIVLAQDVHTLLTDAEKFAWIGELDAVPVGYITGHIECEKRRLLKRRGVIEDWYVAPEARGLSVGKMLLEHLESNFAARGCEALESATWTFNDGARRAHDALGFDEIQVTYRKRIGQE